MYLGTHGKVKRAPFSVTLADLHDRTPPLPYTLEDHNTLVVEYDDSQRAKTCELAFEKKKCSGINFTHAAVLSCFANARQSGLVLDAGAGGCSACIVLDGWLMKSNLEYSKLGGNALDCWFAKLQDSCAQTKAIWDAMESQRTLREKDDFCLPDGTSLAAKVLDLLFDPTPLGNPAAHVPLHELVFTAATKQTSNEIRRSMFFNIVICGGLAATEGFVSRLTKQLATMARADQYRFICSSRQDRFLAPWIGGSILASMPIFAKELLVKRSDYEEFGVDAVTRRCA